MKKLILILLTLGLFSCEKEIVKPTPDRVYEVQYLIEVEQDRDYTVSIFYRDGILRELEYIEGGDFEINITAKEGDILELGYFGILKGGHFKINVNGIERVNFSFGNSHDNEYINVTYQI